VKISVSKDYLERYNKIITEKNIAASAAAIEITITEII
jgi:hypothetical protein